MKRGTLGKLAVVAAVGGAAFEIERRRLVRMRDRDPAWHELNRRLEGRSLEATSADGTRLHVEVFGSDGAPTIVFIHGWLETIRLWHHRSATCRGIFASWRMTREATARATRHEARRTQTKSCP